MSKCEHGGVYVLDFANQPMRLSTCPLCEIERLKALINAPEIQDFSIAIAREAAHQRERWGTEHDEGKTPSDWLWLVAFLVTKATQAERYGDTEKYLHHIVTAAAACCNWHAHATGANTAMKPGAPTPEGIAA